MSAPTDAANMAEGTDEVLETHVLAIASHVGAPTPLIARMDG